MCFNCIDNDFKGAYKMNKKKKYFGLGILLILLVISLLAFQNFKTVSLENDLLEDINLSKVKATTLITPNDKVHFVNETASNQLLNVLKEITLKKTINADPNEFTSVSFSGPGGSFKIFVYDQQYMSIPTDDISTIYKINEKKDYDKLIQILQKY